MALSHDALAESLAGHLRGPDRMVWCDLQLGASGSPRPDVYAICKSYLRPSPIAYECKISLADFRADVTSGKWQTYLTYASGVYFACEFGLFGKSDVPEHCGLMLLKEGRWRAAKKATLASVTIPQSAFLKLVMDGVEREGPRYRARAWSQSQTLAGMRERFGEMAADAIRDRLAVEHEIEMRRYDAERIIDDAKREAERIRKEATESVAPARLELCRLLELPESAGTWQIERALKSLRESLAKHPANEGLRRFTESVRSALNHYGYKEAATENAEVSA